MIRRLGFSASLLGLAFAASPATADTTGYSYDALGRLVSSSVDRGFVVTTAIGYDLADNRSSYQVSGSSTNSTGGYTAARTASSTSTTSTNSGRAISGVSTYTTPAPLSAPMIAKALAGKQGLQAPTFR